jgi:hypothetical protein
MLGHVHDQGQQHLCSMRVDANSTRRSWRGAMSTGAAAKGNRRRAPPCAGSHSSAQDTHQHAVDSCTVHQVPQQHRFVTPGFMLGSIMRMPDGAKASAFRTWIEVDDGAEAAPVHRLVAVKVHGKTRSLACRDKVPELDTTLLKAPAHIASTAACTAGSMPTGPAFVKLCLDGLRHELVLRQVHAEQRPQRGVMLQLGLRSTAPMTHTTGPCLAVPGLSSDASHTCHMRTECCQGTSVCTDCHKGTSVQDGAAGAAGTCAPVVELLPVHPHPSPPLQRYRASVATALPRCAPGACC